MLDSDWKDYLIIEGTKVKIKNMQYSAIGIALVFFFVLKKYFLRAEHGRRLSGAREERGPLMWFQQALVL